MAAAQGQDGQQGIQSLGRLVSRECRDFSWGRRSRRETWVQKTTTLQQAEPEMALGTKKGPGPRHGGMSPIPGINPNSWSSP